MYGHTNYARKKVLGGFFFRNPNTRAAVYSVDGGQTLLIGDVLDAQDGILDDSANCIRRVDTSSWEEKQSPTWSHPVPSREGILIKDFEGLALWSFEQSSRPALVTSPARRAGDPGTGPGS